MCPLLLGPHVSDLPIMFCHFTCVHVTPPLGCESLMSCTGPFSFVRHTLQFPAHLGEGSTSVCWWKEGREGGKEGMQVAAGCH